MLASSLQKTDGCFPRIWPSLDPTDSPYQLIMKLFISTMRSFRRRQTPKKKKNLPSFDLPNPDLHNDIDKARRLTVHEPSHTYKQLKEKEKCFSCH